MALMDVLYKLPADPPEGMIAYAVLASEEMQQIRQLIAALERESDAAYQGTVDEQHAAEMDRWTAFDHLSGCVREWATTPEPKEADE